MLIYNLMKKFIPILIPTILLYLIITTISITLPDVINTASAIPCYQTNSLVKNRALPITVDENNSFASTSSFSGNEMYFVESSANKVGSPVPSMNTIT